MIVLDEQLNDERIIKEIERWYQGKVTVINSLRPGSIIKDDAIPSLLIQQKQPTFVTINYADFWPKMLAHSSYCAVCFKLPVDRKLELPTALRSLLNLSEFDAWQKRAGKIISVADGTVRYYE